MRVLFIILGFVFSTLSLAAKTHAPIPGQYIVKLRKSSDRFQIQNLNGTFKGQIESLDANSSYLKISRSPEENPQKVIKELLSLPEVELAERNTLIELFQAPDDDQYPTQWGLHNSGQPNEWGVQGLPGVDINAETAWNLTTGSKSVVVAIIDSGMNYNHPDLKDNAWVNLAELNGKPNVDDDANGFVDDIYGYDFFNNKGDPLDDNGHGTHAAGVIGASGNNKYGLTGVNWNVKLMPIKFTNNKVQGSLEGAIKGIQYAVKMGANIINASWGSEDASEILSDAIREAGQKNVLFVAAAGNNSRDNDSKLTKPVYPASFNLPTIISVASINQKGALSSFSCYGAERVHLAAPGENIWSTWIDGGYKKQSGTSVAAPFVSGVAALLLSHEPNLTALQLKERLIKTAAPLKNLTAKVFAQGRVDAGFALLNQTAPADPNDPDLWSFQNVKIATNHPYKESENSFWEIYIPGAKAISVYFDKFALANEYDFVDIHDRSGRLVSRLYGKSVHGWSQITVGDYIKITLTSDQDVQDYGFDITKAAFKAEPIH
jgi:subtilisin family serine protease